MATLSEYMSDLYTKATVPDPRTGDWLLMSAYWPTWVIVACYVTFVVVGIRYMRDREPYQLKDVLMVYNFCLVLLNAYIFFQFVATTWLNFSFSKVCAPVDASGDPRADQLAAACWVFYFSKSIELMDTVFFVLRKKNQQISFLHVYHHSTMPLIWWIGVRYAPGGEAYFSASINSGIHILMYTYYLLSAMGPHMQKYLWWKRYMTVMQLLQFWAILFHTSYAIYTDCGFPNLYNWALIFYDFSHIALFSNFYYQTYTKAARAARAKKLENSGKTSNAHQNGIVNGVKEGPAKKRTRKD